MDNILLCSNHIPLVTSIHNTFIEKYMMGANGSYVKVYLYLSKCIQAGQEDLSISSLADQMENTEKDVLRALNYWEKQGLLAITRGEDKGTILGIDVLNPDELPDTRPSPRKIPAKSSRENASAGEQNAHEPKKASTKAASVSPAAADTEHMSSAPKERQSFRVTAEQSRRLTKDDEFCWTCNVVESYLGRPVKPGEMQLLSYLYDTLHFSSELILHLYEYCIALGKTSTSYIQAVAVSWDEKQIKTPEQAKNASSIYNASYTAISKAFVLGRPLAAVERTYVDRWQNDWQMDLSVTLEACNRTMLKLQHADFKYTEGILDKWHKAGIHTLQDIEKADTEHRSRSSQGSPQQPAPPRRRSKNNQSNIVQHGLTRDDADALEKKLLEI